MPRPDLKQIVVRIANEHRIAIGLDRLGEICVEENLTNTEIEEVVILLEEHGVGIDHDKVAPAKELLHQIVPAARALRTELGRAPSVTELADRTGLTQEETKYGLFYLRVLSR